ncbi:DnaD domain-containing protein [Anaerobacillus sp. MEB173]|uniref:DnaD domain-containing protein n=1 Tax=Anaerobacillus sp. MEB173 TaxID=3383345 RepID=UPI003F920EEE
MDKQIMKKWITAGHVSIPKLLFQYYVKLKLDEKELMGLLHIHTYIESGNYFPTPDVISERMTLSQAECAELMRCLVKKGYLELKQYQDENQVMYETFSIEPLWESLLLLLQNEKQEAEKKSHEQEETNLYSIFEKEFSRPLSPMECETLSMWIDQDGHSSTMIIAALREGVISGKLNFRYIDRILFEWKKNGIQTVEQAKQYGEKIRKHYQRPRRSEEKEKTAHSFPNYNWLEQ